MDEDSDSINPSVESFSAIAPLIGLADRGIPDPWPMKEPDPLGASAVPCVTLGHDVGKFIKYYFYFHLKMQAF